MRITMLGLGNMGSAMAANLIAAGHDVTVFNRDRQRTVSLGKKGAHVATTPAEAAQAAEVIMSMVTGDEASREIWLGPQGVVAGKPSADALAIECSTVSHTWIMELAKAVEAKGLRFLDCPVAGRPDVAAAGKLVVFAGGDAKDVQDARPALEAIGKSIVHFGDVGSGLSFKLIYNMLGAVQVAATAEAMAACAAAGMDLPAAAEAFSTGSTGSAHVARHAKAMASQTYSDPVQFTPVGRVKDLNYGIDMAEGFGSGVKMGRAARSLFQAMADNGLAEHNDSELFVYLRDTETTG